jgi:hypothetical protein
MLVCCAKDKLANKTEKVRLIILIDGEIVMYLEVMQYTKMMLILEKS